MCGCCTYVKGSGESNGDVGDRANNAISINGGELRCKVVGEGGNLGFPQCDRIEAAHNGVLLNTDFTDDSAGVDPPDHEGNVKIGLNGHVQAGERTVEDLHKPRKAMNDELADPVLTANYRPHKPKNRREGR